MMAKIKTAVLGATGTVGQRFVSLLASHPWFELVAVAASPASAGKRYADAVRGRWTPAVEVPTPVAGLTLARALEDRGAVAADVELAFSALDLDKETTRAVEEEYAASGVAVVSANSAHRWTEDVPMIIPEINAGHVALVDGQRARRRWGRGLLAVKPNCSLQSYVPVVKAWERFAPQRVSVTTLQAVSGAGRTLDDWPEMRDNVIPYIPGEEEKSEREPLKILGAVNGRRIRLAQRPAFSATCLRVPVSDGHLAAASIEFEKPATGDELRAALADFRPATAGLDLPSAPERFLYLYGDDDRPQPRRDRDVDGGMAVAVGRLHEDGGPRRWKFVALSHNTVRGAGGGAVLLAELLVAKGYISPA
ncbi:MAG: aspartate-semialdehyde dehydrogenase [candidate division Zixibacteria bacterium]|nr:aspartate-semialdehyde dehydrogenase [candidate division Zixibacteria bacterium]